MRYVGDSNLDWGQDLWRLRAFVDAHQIDKIAVDYFGSSSPAMSWANDTSWQSAAGPYKGWLAVSVTNWQIARAYGRPDQNTLTHGSRENAHSQDRLLHLRV